MTDSEAFTAQAYRRYEEGGGDVLLPARECVISTPLPILPGVNWFGDGMYRTRLVKDSSPGPVFEWHGEAGRDGHCMGWTIQALLIDYGKNRPLDARDIAIHLPLTPGGEPPYPWLFSVEDVRIHGAYHGIKDTSGAFMGSWKRIELRRCSRGVEKALGTTTLFENVFPSGQKNADRDCFGFYLHGTRACSLVNCGTDEYSITQAPAAVVCEDTYGTLVHGFNAENNTVLDAVFRNVGGEKPELHGLAAVNNRRFDGQPAPMI